ncbi:hypothetical protein F5Y18DRAFT_391543 [Xylariaceae sp. FL1019]|nr:hypothetical protein F5Y18DRAFT_391543 [Xylariaceae sp. FL1019]
MSHSPFNKSRFPHSLGIILCLSSSVGHVCRPSCRVTAESQTVSLHDDPCRFLPHMTYGVTLDSSEALTDFIAQFLTKCGYCLS